MPEASMLPDVSSLPIPCEMVSVPLLDSIGRCFILHDFRMLPLYVDSFCGVSAVSSLHKLYTECLAVVKRLSRNELFESLDMQTISVSADAILYAHALEAVSAPLSTLFACHNSR